jgi:hypothetical protein
MKDPRTRKAQADAKKRAINMAELAAKQWARLVRHQERYVKAYCLKFLINPDELGDYELVTDTQILDDGMTRTRTYMRRKPSPIILA